MPTKRLPFTGGYNTRPGTVALSGASGVWGVGVWGVFIEMQHAGAICPACARR